MLWINFLHLYQPATADAHIIKEATEKSYLRIISALEKNSKIKFTLNINGSLIERWEELGYEKLIKRISVLIKKGQIELTGTAFYHPLLPLIPEEEAIKQIKEQEKIIKKYFGANIKLPGFFLPEMAYGSLIGKLIKKLGYKWIILGEMSFDDKQNEPEVNKIYQDKKNGLKAVFRSTQISKSYAPDKLSKIIKTSDKDKIIITATDAELYGLRHNDPTGEFEKLLKNKKLKTMTISEFIGKNKKIEKIKFLDASWETTEKEIKMNQPYTLWFDKKNKIQQKLWELADLAYRSVSSNKKDENYYWASWHLSRGLASCTFWWASGRDFRHVFGPFAWGPDEIEKGANELIRSIRTLSNAKTRKSKLKAEKIYTQLKHIIWKKHWGHYWEKITYAK